MCVAYLQCEQSFVDNYSFFVQKKKKCPMCSMCFTPLPSFRCHRIIFFFNTHTHTHIVLPILNFVVRKYWNLKIKECYTADTSILCINILNYNTSMPQLLSFHIVEIRPFCCIYRRNFIFINFIFRNCFLLFGETFCILRKLLHFW